MDALPHTCIVCMHVYLPQFLLFQSVRNPTYLSQLYIQQCNCTRTVCVLHTCRHVHTCMYVPRFRFVWGLVCGRRLLVYCSIRWHAIPTCFCYTTFSSMCRIFIALCTLLCNVIIHFSLCILYTLWRDVILLACPLVGMKTFRSMHSVYNSCLLFHVSFYFLWICNIDRYT